MVSFIGILIQFNRTIYKRKAHSWSYLSLIFLARGLACGFPKKPFKLHSDLISENLCRSGISVDGFDLVSAGHQGCGNDPEEYIWIAYEGSLPADSGHSGSVPAGWCVLENYRYKQNYRLLETNGANNWVLIPPPSEGGNPERLEKHFKAVPHGNGQFKIVNAAGNQILEMKINQNVWKVSSMNPMSPMQIQNLFSFKEVDEGSGKASWSLDVSSIFWFI